MASALTMDNSLLSTKPHLQKILQDVLDCIQEMRSDFYETEIPVNDDSLILQRFCAKLEFLLQTEQKQHVTFLGARKDYWNYICESLQNMKGLNDGIKFVKSLTELKTNTGRGRAFIRFALMHHRLGDSLQQCIMNVKLTSDWFTPKSLWLQTQQWSVLINALYDLNDVQFDLLPKGYDLDNAWPTFARKVFGGSPWLPPSRSSSISSLSSLQDATTPSRINLSTTLENDYDDLQLEAEQFESENIVLTQTIQDLASERDMLANQIAELQQNAAQKQQVVEAELKSVKIINIEFMEKVVSLEEFIQTNNSTWKDKELSWEKDIHNFKTENLEQTLEIKLLTEQLSASVDKTGEKTQQCDQLKSELLLLGNKNNELLGKVEELINDKQNKASCDLDSVTMLQQSASILATTESTLRDTSKERDELLIQITRLNCEIDRQCCHSDAVTKQCTDLESRSSKTITRLETLVDNLTVDVSESQTVIQELREKVNKTEKHNSDITQENVQNIDEFKLQIHDLDRKLKNRSNTIVEKDQFIEKLKNKITDLAKNRENMESLKIEKEHDLKDQLKESVRLNEDIKNEIVVLREELQLREESVEREKLFYNEKISEYIEEKDRLQDNINKMAADNNKMAADNDEQKSQICELQQDISQMSCDNQLLKEKSNKLEILEAEQKKITDTLVKSDDSCHSDSVENYIVQLQLQLKTSRECCVDQERRIKLLQEELNLSQTQLQCVEAEREEVLKTECDEFVRREEAQRNIDIEDQKKEISSMEDIIKQKHSRIEELQDNVVVMEETLNKTKTEVDKFSADNRDLHKYLDDLRYEIQDKLSEIEKLRLVIVDIETELGRKDKHLTVLDISNKRLTNEMKLLQELVETANESSRRFEGQIEKFEGRVSEMSNSFESLQQDNERLMLESEQLKVENVRMRNTIDAINDEKKSLEQDQDLLEKSLVVAFEEKLEFKTKQFTIEHQKYEKLLENSLCKLCQTNLTSHDLDITNTATVYLNTGSVSLDTGTVSSDTGTVSSDTGSVSLDTGTVSLDTGTVSLDTGSVSLDTGTVSLDTGTVSLDTGTVSLDTGTVSLDTGTVSLDTGTVSLDTGTVSLDTGTVSLDTGTVSLDTGTVSLDTVSSMNSECTTDESVISEDVDNFLSCDSSSDVTSDPGNQVTSDPGNQVDSDPGNLVTSDPGNQVDCEVSEYATANCDILLDDALMFEILKNEHVLLKNNCVELNKQLISKIEQYDVIRETVKEAEESKKETESELSTCQSKFDELTLKYDRLLTTYETCCNETCSNEKCSNETCSNETCSNVTCSNVTCSNVTCSNERNELEKEVERLAQLNADYVAQLEIQLNCQKHSNHRDTIGFHSNHRDTIGFHSHDGDTTDIHSNHRDTTDIHSNHRDTTDIHSNHRDTTDIHSNHKDTTDIHSNPGDTPGIHSNQLEIEHADNSQNGEGNTVKVDGNQQLLQLEEELFKTRERLEETEERLLDTEGKLSCAEDEIEQLNTAVERELANIEYQLEAEKIQHESALQGYTIQGFDLAKMVDRMNDQETLIQTLELELQEIKHERDIEQEKQWEELQQLKLTFIQTQEENKQLNELNNKVCKNYAEERENVVKLQTEIGIFRSVSGELQQRKDNDISMLVNDTVELKKKLIRLIKEKDSLWQKTDKLEYQQRRKAAETWMDDTDVLRCCGCRSEFSFMVRKHHCRLCGRIFCHNCSNNWILTTHSSKKSRVCNKCFIERESEKETDVSDEEVDDEMIVPVMRKETWDSFNTTNTNSPSDVDTDIDSSVVDQSSSFSLNIPDSPSIHSFLNAHNANATDEDKKLFMNNDSEFHTTTDDLTSTLQVVVDGEEVDDDNNDDVFHLISDEEIARSLSMSGNNPTSGSLSTSVEINSTVNAETMEDVGCIESELTVDPGKMLALPVDIKLAGTTLRWEFKTQPKSMPFSVSYRVDETVAPDNAQILVPSCNCNSHKQAVHGELVARQPGIYTLLFNNTPSRFLAKKLIYKLELKEV